MKIFYKKDFQRVLGEKKELEKEFEQYKIDAANNISALEEKAFELLKENSKLKDSSLKQENVLSDEINTLKLKLGLVKDKLKKANTSKGGFTKQFNKLKKLVKQYEKEISDLNAKIKDLESDRYLRVPLPPDKTKSTIKTKIAPPMKPSVRRFMKANFDD